MFNFARSPLCLHCTAALSQLTVVLLCEGLSVFTPIVNQPFLGTAGKFAYLMGNTETSYLVEMRQGGGHSC